MNIELPEETVDVIKELEGYNGNIAAMSSALNENDVYEYMNQLEDLSEEVKNRIQKEMLKSKNANEFKDDFKFYYDIKNSLQFHASFGSLAQVEDTFDALINPFGVNDCAWYMVKYYGNLIFKYGWVTEKAIFFQNTLLLRANHHIHKQKNDVDYKNDDISKEIVGKLESINKLFVVYAKYMLIDVINKDIIIQKNECKKDKQPTREEFYEYKKIKKNIIIPEITNYFEKLMECNQKASYSYYLDERLDYYKKIQERYSKILLSSDLIKSFSDKLFSKYYDTMFNKFVCGTIIYPTRNKQEAHNDIIKEIYNNFKLYFKEEFDFDNELITTREELLITKLIDRAILEFYEELYYFLIYGCNLYYDEILRDLDKYK